MTDEPIVISKWVWLGLVVVVMFVIGLLISPLDKSNRPILMLPDIKAVEDYRQSISTWHSQMLSLDADIASVLSGKFGSDLFEKSREAQKIMDKAISIARDVDSQSAPTAAYPAKSLLVKSTGAYLEASRAMLQWVTTPTSDNLALAQNALQVARQTLDHLEQSEWIHQ